MMMLSAAGCYYGSGMGYGSYANANKIKTTAAADTLEEFKITDFQAADGTFQYKDLGWLSSYQDLERDRNADWHYDSIYRGRDDG